MTPVVIIDEDDIGRYGTGKSNLHPRVQQEVENDAMKHETTIPITITTTIATISLIELRVSRLLPTLNHAKCQQ